MAPWFQLNGYLFFAGVTGKGKSFVLLGLAMAVATGGSILGFRAPKIRGVLYMDGEMAPADVQNRLPAMENARRLDDNGEELDPTKFILLSHHDNAAICLDGQELTTQEDVEDVLVETGVDLLIADNLSTLCRNGENDNDAWQVMQDWIGRLNRQDITVCVVHHTGKPNQNTGTVSQRGASRKRDKATSSILLTKKDGSKFFTLQWDKQRLGAEPRDLNARIEWLEEISELRLVSTLKQASKSKSQRYSL